MKPDVIYLGLLLSILLVSSVDAQQGDFPVLRGPYLGQEPPGNRPEMFAPGIISVDANFEHSAAVFSPDGSEVYWCTNVDRYTERGQQGMLRLYYMKMVDGVWTAPQLVPSTKDIRVERPVFSPDGNKLYIEYGSDPSRESHTDIYVVRRTGDGWSEPEPVSPLINSTASERLNCVTADGSLYFTRNLMRADEAVFVSRVVDGEFTEPEKLGPAYNTDAVEFMILVAPDEEYMLIAQSNDRHTSDLTICYKRPDGSWTERIKIPYYCGGFLALSPDGKYLFHLNEGICWVSTSFVDELRPK